MGGVKQQSFILLTNLQSGQSQWGQLVTAPHCLPGVEGWGVGHKGQGVTSQLGAGIIQRLSHSQLFWDFTWD